MSSKRSSASTNERLFACTNCHKRCKFEDLSSCQQLCKLCRKQFPSVTCCYCKLEFHPVKATENPSIQACEYCARDLKQYGKPTSCVVCTLQSAFSGRKCTRCLHSQKKYGPPSVCEHCSTRCAFPKPADIKRKVDGKTLCLLCTIKYKKEQFTKKKMPKGSSSVSSSSKRLHYNSDFLELDYGRPMQKMMKFDPTLPLSQVPHVQPVLLPTRETQPALDILTSNHILETDKLQNEISSIKKQMLQKDQALIEKDKQICQLRADASEKERDFRIKQMNQQKTYSEVVEQFQIEIRSLRTQLSKLSQKKSSSNFSDKQSLASITSSLAATPNSSSS